MAGMAAGLGTLVRRGVHAAASAVRSGAPVSVAFGRNVVGQSTTTISSTSTRGLRWSAGVHAAAGAAAARKKTPGVRPGAASTAPPEGAELLEDIPLGWLPDASAKHEEGVGTWTPTGTGGYPKDWAEVNETEWRKDKKVCVQEGSTLACIGRA